MEVTNIETKTFEKMMSKFEEFMSKVNQLSSVNNKHLSDWLDGEEVCLYLKISKRTLQTYRDKGTIPFTRINHKMYYKAQEVKKLLVESK